MYSLLNIKSLAIIVALVIILSTIIILTSRQPKTPSSTPPQFRSVQPTSYPNLAPPSISPSASVDNNFIEYSQNYLDQQDIISEQEKNLNDQALAVSQFINTLPFSGQYINVSYNIYDNQVYLEYSKNNKDQALMEFTNLLKKNNIQNLDWLYNLKIAER